MRPLRVMTVDDSVVVRLMVAEALRGEKDFELAGFAQNGQVALDKLTEIAPDLIVLDVEMPVMDGLTTLLELRKRRSKIPVVMFSTLTSRGASATIEALTRGASDYVQKPSAASREESLQLLRAELLPKLRALGAKALAGPRAPVATPRARRTALGPVDVVVIGVSTGGPNALADMLPGLPADLPVPVLIVQHMPPAFTGMLAKRLDSLCPLTVAEAQGGEVLAPGQVWVAPGGKHLVVKKVGAHVVTAINEEPPENSCRPAADPLFRSVVAAYGARVLSVVMTGMGSDGHKGTQAVVAAGGQVIAQDAESCVVYGMPRFVVEAGLADAVLSLEHIAAEITRRTGAGLVCR
ncbi:MAG: chemotaxis response regulator protein-glutamate methylesterase [Mycobacteriales bacterium]|nr:chemotaxis response regulator protein-glutamate methylesterase [Mycobacteriales bacterium]